jgi:hypothetical protein
LTRQGAYWDDSGQYHGAFGTGGRVRYLSAIALLFASLFCAVVFAGPDAKAAVAPTAALSPPPPPPAQLAATAGKLTQRSAGLWTTTVYVDTGALCPAPLSFDLLTTKPYTDTTDASPQYVGGPPCGTHPKPITTVELSFAPGPALSSVPQSATLALTPSQAALAEGVIPLDIPLTVRRQVTAAQYVWIPVGFGLALTILLIAATIAFGVPRPSGGTAHRGFWRIPLYAASAWTFRDSWATNITAIGAVIGTVLTATGSVGDLLPGLDLGRFSLLIALAGGITVFAPLLFSVLNYRFSRLDPATAGVVAIGLPPGHGGEGVRISVLAGGTVTIHPAQSAGQPPDKGATIDLPAGSEMVVAPKPEPGAEPGCLPVLVLPGGTDITVARGQLITVDGAAHDAPAGASVSFLGQVRVAVPASACVMAPGEPVAAEPAGAPASPRRTTPRNSPRAEPFEFTLPRSADVVAARMGTMLAASCLTVFGIGAEIGVTGWVLCFGLAVAPDYARWLSLLAGFGIAAFLLVYGVLAIRSLADSRNGSTLANAGNSSFML